MTGADYCELILYRTKNERYFIVDHLNQFTVLNKSETIDWLEQHRGHRVILKHFMDAVDEA